MMNALPENHYVSICQCRISLDLEFVWTSSFTLPFYSLKNPLFAIKNVCHCNNMYLHLLNRTTFLNSVKAYGASTWSYFLSSSFPCEFMFYSIRFSSRTVIVPKSWLPLGRKTIAELYKLEHVLTYC